MRSRTGRLEAASRCGSISILPRARRARQPAVLCLGILCAVLGAAYESGAVPAQDLLAGSASRETQRAVGVLEAGLANSRQRLAELQTRMVPALEEVEELTRQLDALPTKPPPPPDTAPKNKPPGAKKVPFRPPFIRTTKKEGSVAIVCEEDRVTIVDVDAVGEQIKPLAQQAAESGNGSKGGPVTLPRGHFDIAKYEVRVLELGTMRAGLPSIELVRKAGHQGELADALEEEKSEISQLLAGRNPDVDYFQFVVYPDSFEVFRQARAAAWKRRFEVRWIPLPSGDPIQIGAGQGSVD